MWTELTQALNNLDIPADWVGIRGMKEIASTHQVRNGLPQANGKHLTLGAMLEVMVNGCVGYAATNSLTLPSLRSAAQIAYQQAVLAREWWIYKFPDDARPQVVGEYNSPFLEPLDVWTAGEINDLLLRICEKLQISDKIIQTNASINTSEKETWFLSSNGSEVYQKILTMRNCFGAIAKEGNIIQQRTNNGFEANSYQGGWELLKQDELWEKVEQVAEQAVELLTSGRMSQHSDSRSFSSRPNDVPNP